MLALCWRGLLYIMTETYIDGYIRSNKASFLLKDFFLTYKCAPSDREGSLMTHKESPPVKNSFLEDLDKLDVSVFLGGNKTDEQLHDM